MRTLVVPAALCTFTLLTVALPAGGASASDSPVAADAAVDPQVRLTGVLRKIAFDAVRAGVGATFPADAGTDLHGFERADHEIHYSIVTPGGASVPLDAGTVPVSLASAGDGAPVSADVSLDDHAQDQLEDAGVDVDGLAEHGAVTTRAAQVLQDSATAVDVAAVVAVPSTGEQRATTLSAPPATFTTTTTTTVAHRAYLVAVSDSAVTGDFSLTGSAAEFGDAATYWVAQARGRISGFTVAGRQTLNLPNSCPAGTDQARAADRAWTAARGKFPGVSFGGRSGNHLIVFLPAGCQKTLGYAGVGTVGSGLDTGGQILVLDDAWSVLAHELGHNLGLGHSNLTSTTSGRETVYEYYGVFGPQALAVGDHPPGSLDLAYQAFLGIASAAAVKDLAPASTTTTTLAPVYAASAVRGLRFTDPRTGDLYWVEYRTGAGQDSAAYYSGFTRSDPLTVTSAGQRRGLNFAPGARIYRWNAADRDLDTVTTLRSDSLLTTLGANGTYTAPSGGFTVKAQAATGSSVEVVVAVADRAASTTSVTVPRSTYGSPATASIQVAASRAAAGKADVYVSGTKVGTATVTAGSASYRLPSTVPAGDRDVTVKYLGSGTVKPSARSAGFTVGKARATVSLTSMSTTRRGAQARASIRLTGVAGQAPTGKVRLKVGSTYVTGWYTVRKTSNSWGVTVTTARLPRGTVKVVYSGNANLAGATYTTDRNVR